MHRRFACLLAVYCTATHAQIEAAAAPQQVVISGAQTDLEAGQDFVAGKIIIGQKKIADSGLQNTGELLRREPAISVDKSGRIGLLGLPGYTQVLVDGQPPAGDTMNIDLVRVERIEIAKTTTAATGPFGVAGTINIILRKKAAQDLVPLARQCADRGWQEGHGPDLDDHRCDGWLVQPYLHAVTVAPLVHRAQ